MGTIRGLGVGLAGGKAFRMQLNEKSIFLMDGLGALLSASCTGLLLPFYSEWIGLPNRVLFGLAALALAYSIYSLSCFFFIKRIRPAMLLAIIAANLIYCLIAAAVLVSALEITKVGEWYLIGESAIILGIILVEAKVYREFSAHSISPG